MQLLSILPSSSSLLSVMWDFFEGYYSLYQKLRCTETMDRAGVRQK